MLPRVTQTPGLTAGQGGGPDGTDRPGLESASCGQLREPDQLFPAIEGMT